MLRPTTKPGPLFILLLFALLSVQTAAAQENEDSDPLKGTYKLGSSSEIILLWGDPDDHTTRVLTIYEVRRLVDADMTAGTYNVSFDAEGLAGGVDLYRLEIDGTVRTKTMVLIP